MSAWLILLVCSVWGAEPVSFSLTAGGDAMFGRYTKGSYREVGGPDPFQAISVHLRASDLTFVNLESPLMDGHPARMPAAPRGLVFRGSAERATQMAAAGIDVVTLANNHAEDLRMAGVKSSESILEAAGIALFGADSDGDPFAPVEVRSGETSVFFLAATTRRNIGEPRKDQWIPSAYRHWRWLKDELPQRVRDTRLAHPDSLILVSMHWGEEYVTDAPREHQGLARAVIDAGANGVLGHHPHVLQPIEVYKGAPILYSMGNLIFDQRSLSRRQSGLFTMNWERLDTGAWDLVALDMLPIMLRGGRSGPTLASIEEARPILDAAIRGAAVQNTRLVEREGRVHWTREESVSVPD